MNKILVIPHVGVSGGAGLYIKQVLKELNKSFDLSVGGEYSNYYDNSGVHLDTLWNRVVFPYYRGVSFKVVIYYLLKSLVSLLRLRFIDNNKLQDFDVVVLTSGVQALLVPFISLYYRNTKIIILVQENWRFDGFFLGSISKMIFSKVDLVVSITDSWKAYANENDICSFVYRNMYESGCLNDNTKEKKLDFIYMGGEERIKGYVDFLYFCKEITKIREVHIGILGKVSEASADELKGIFSKSVYGSTLSLLGFVDDVSSVLAGSKILILPIAAPHFCRPAIEAGFNQVPFIIKKHEGMTDFAIPGYNCELYDSLDALVEIAVEFLDDQPAVKQYGINNYENSLGFLHYSSVANVFLKKVQAL
jgi:hypothetical protein